MNTRHRRNKPEDASPSGAKKGSRSRGAKQKHAAKEPIEVAPAGVPPAANAQEQMALRPLFAAPIAVRWRDLDAFNHVNNSSYFTFLEEARLQWLRTIEGEWFNEHAMPVIAAIVVNYRAPIVWPSSITVELFCDRIGNSSLTVGHRIVDADGAHSLYCDGHAVLVWTDPATGQPVPLPKAIRIATNG